MPASFALALHASYGCRDSGACCTAGWPIPIEPANLARAEQAAHSGRLRSPAGATPLFERPPHAPDEAPALVAVHQGACVFYRRDGAARCALHRALGHAALPLACRQFPRVSVQDPRGTSITLSHYCPTAASLLEADGGLRIEEDPPAFPAGGEYVGLDVRQALPPLLRPDMLMDWNAWWQWERESIALIDAASSSHEALARLHDAVEHVRTWRPSDGALGDRVTTAFARARLVAPRSDAPADADALVAAVVDAIPAELRDTRSMALRAVAVEADTRRRFLAAHAFANWTAHLGQGLRTWLRSLEAADVLLRRGLAVRDVDLWIRHLADPNVLAARLAPVEGASGPLDR